MTLNVSYWESFSMVTRTQKDSQCTAKIDAPKPEEGPLFLSPLQLPPSSTMWLSCRQFSEKWLRSHGWAATLKHRLGTGYRSLWDYYFCNSKYFFCQTFSLNSQPLLTEVSSMNWICFTQLFLEALQKFFIHALIHLKILKQISFQLNLSKIIFLRRDILVLIKKVLSRDSLNPSAFAFSISILTCFLLLWSSWHLFLPSTWLECS